MNDVSLREFIERIIVENNLRRDSERKADQRAFAEYKQTTERALKLLASQRGAAIAVTLATLSLAVATFTAAVFYLKS